MSADWGGIHTVQTFSTCNVVDYQQEDESADSNACTQPCRIKLTASTQS